MRQINETGLSLIESYETLSLVPYDDGYGFLTIGWGHKMLPGDSGVAITPEEADALLYYDLRLAEEAVTRLVTEPLNDNQFAALVSFVFNVGQGHFSGSTMRRMLNKGDFAGAVKQFARWDMSAGQHSNGLKRRRSEEASLFVLPVA